MRLAKVFLLLLLSAIGHRALGRLGETEIQCADRYGSHKPDPAKLNRLLADVPGAVRRTYHYQGWIIRVGFLNDVAVREEYTKHPMIQIKDFELAAILQSEAEGKGEWRERRIAMALTAGLSGRFWERSDGATAALPYGSFTLRLDLPAAIQAEAAAKREREERERAAVPKF